MQIFEKLKQSFGSAAKMGEDLSKYTTFNIGGSAKYFCVANSQEELVELGKFARKNNLAFLVLGGGSNVLVSDDGFDGLTVKNDIKYLKVKGDLIECGSGVLLSKLVGQALASGLAGLEWATGIPGTIGGAINSNAGAYGGDIAHSLKEVAVARRNQSRTLDKKQCKFSYRDSIFKHKNNSDIILSAVFQLRRGEQEDIKSKMEEIAQERRKKFNQGYCAGSIFKNLEVSAVKLEAGAISDDFIKSGIVSAGWLIDQCGLKGLIIGGAQISDKNANIILNNNNAKSQDVIDLITVCKEKVLAKFGCDLEEEVQLIGFNNN